MSCDGSRLSRGARVQRGEINSRTSDSGRDLWTRLKAAFGESYFKSLGEFDPGSGRTLAACLTHASQGGSGNGATGERVRNT